MTIPRINIEALRGSGVYVFDVTDELVRWGQAFNAWADVMDVPVLIDGDDHGQTSGPSQPTTPVTAESIAAADNIVQPMRDAEDRAMEADPALKAEIQQAGHEFTSGNYTKLAAYLSNDPSDIEKPPVALSSDETDPGISLLTHI